MKAKINSLFPKMLKVCLCGAALTTTASAADVVKDNNTTSMNIGSSWVGGVVPTATDTIVFDDIFAQTGSIGTGAPLGYAGIRVEGSTVTSTVNINNTTAANHVAPGALGIDMSNSPRSLTVASLQVDVDQTWKVGSAEAFRTLTLAGTELDGSGQVTVQGPGNLSLGANNKLANGFIVDGARILTGSAGGFGTSAVTQRILDGGGAFISAAVTIPANFEIAGEGWSEPTGKLGAIRLTGTTVSGSILLKSNSRITAHGSTGTISGVISDGGDNFALDLGNYNTGTDTTLTVSGTAPNTYTGGTTVTGAIVRGLKDGAFGDGPITVRSNGTANRVTRLQPEGITLNNNIFLSSSALTSFRGALHAAGGLTSTINGTVTIDTGVGNGGHLAAENNTTSVLRVMGPIQVAGAVSTPSVRIGTVELGGGGNYGALNHNQGTLRLAADEGINTGANLGSAGSGDTIFDLNGFDQTLGRFTTNNTFLTTITNSHATDPSTLTLAGDLNSSFGVFNPGTTPLHIVKNGASTLAVTGTSTGTAPGSVTVNSGGLTVSGLLGGSATTVTLADGTTLSGEGTIGGNLSLGSSSGAKLVIDASTPGSLLVEGNVAVGGVVEVSASGAPAGSPIQVLDYMGTLAATAANFSAPTFRGASFDVGAGTDSQVTMSYGAPVDLTWTGSVNNTWAAGGDANWVNSLSQADKFYNSDNVSFNDGAAGTGEITIAVPTGVTAGNISFNNSSKDFRVEGPGSISGLDLTKDGAGSVTLATAGSLSGWTDVLAGTLTLDFTNGNPATGTTGVLIEDGATLRLVHSDGAFSFDRSIEGAGTLVLNPHNTVGSTTSHAIAWTGSNPGFTGMVVLAQPASGTARITSVQAVTLGGADIVVAGGNQLYTASQTYSNPITLTGFGFADTGGFLGALRLESGAAWNGPVTITGTPGDSGGATADASIGTFNGTATINGAIGGGDLLLTGYNSTDSETFVLTAPNTFGDLIITASDTPASGQVAASIGDIGTTAINSSATLGSGNVYLIGGAAGKAAALRIQRADGYTLAQDVIGAGNKDRTVLIADTTGAGLSLGGRTVDIGEQVRLGGNVNGAILNIDPGSVVNAGFVFTGNATGNSTIVNQTGGAVTASDHVRVAHWPSETSIWNMNAGSLTITGVPVFPTDGGPGGGTNEAPGMLYVGVDGQGVFNQSGGTVAAYGLVLDNRGNTGAGTNMETGIDEYNLTGGSLTLNASGIRGNASTAFNLGGGKLAAAADFAAAIPLNLTAAGSVIETNGFTVGIVGGLTGAFPLAIADTPGSGTGRLGFAPTGSVTVSAALSGNAGVRVNGPGAVTLAGVNTYTGPTEVWQGTLAITGSLAGTNLEVDGGTLATGGSLTGNLTLSPTLDSAIAYTGSPLAVTGNVTIAGPVEVDPLATAPIAAGSYPLVTYTGSLIGSAASFTVPDDFVPGDYRQAFSFTAGGGNISLVVTGAAGNLVWNGPGDWDLKTSSTWQGGEVFYQLDAVTFNDAGSDGAVNIPGEVRPVSVVVDNDTLAYTFGGTGSIEGATSLVKQGPGTLTVTNVNGYTGGTLIKGGVLQLDPLARLGTGAITISAGTLRGLQNAPYINGSTNPVILGDANSGTAETIIEFPGSTTAGNNIMSMPVTVSSAAPNSKAIIRCITTLGAVAYYGGPITLENRDLYFESAGNQLTGITGKISGTGNLHITRSTTGNVRTRLLNNSNDFAGDIYVDGDAHLQIGTGSPSGTITSIPFGADLILAANARARATGGGSLTGTTNNGVTTVGGLWGGGIVDSNVSGSTTTRLWLGNADKNGVFNGVMQNENANNRLALTKVGTGTQVLNGTCTFTGTTTVNGGTLAINNAFASAVTVNAGATLSGIGTLGSTLTATTAGATVAPGSSTGTLSVTGTVNLAGGTLAIEIDDTATPKNDTLAAAGTLNLTDAILNVAVTGTPGQSAYVIASYGTLTGTFNEALSTIPAGYVLNYNYNSLNQIALVSTTDPYLLWAEQIPNPADRDRGDDPDGDGFTNLEEFLFGTSPVAATGSLTTIERSGGNLVIRWKQRASGATYQLMESATLTPPWVPSGATVTNDGPAAGDYQPKKAEVPIAPGKDFFRVEGVEN